MIFKSYQIEKDLEKILNFKIFVFYGENEGLKKEFKKKLKDKVKKNEIINFFQEDIIKNKDLLVREIANKSLFNENKTIFINQVNEKLFDVIENISETLDNEKIYLFAEPLDKRSKLRAFFEKQEQLGIVPCYQDNEITLQKLIVDKLNGYTGLNQEIINLMIQTSNLDRNKLNNEIEKIQICFSEKKIEKNKIEALLNIKTNEDFAELKDAAIKGNKIKTNRLLADTIFEGENNVYYLNSINQRINKLKEIEDLKQNSSNIEVLVAGLKPPVFWKDKPILIEQSKKWNKKKIGSALKKTYDAEIDIKSNSNINKNLIIKKLIIDLCSTANAS